MEEERNEPSSRRFCEQGRREKRSANASTWRPSGTHGVGKGGDVLLREPQTDAGNDTEVSTRSGKRESNENEPLGVLKELVSAGVDAELLRKVR
jgi:hypothetical protein